MPKPLHDLMSYLRVTIGACRNDPRDDAELLARFAENRDETAFSTLIWRHGKLVWRTCKAILPDTPDAEDVFQTVFLTLARKAGRQSIKSPAGWLHRVARQAALNVRAAAQRRHNLENKLLETSQSNVKKVDQNEQYALLDEELAGLPEKLRVPLVLCFLEEKTQDEVARILGCSHTSVQRRLAKGEAILRDRLERRGLAFGAFSIAALLRNTASTSSVPAGLIASTARAAAAFRVGEYAGGVAEGTEKLLRVLARTGTTQKLWWVVVVVCVGALGVGEVGFVAWKMYSGGSNAVTPAVPDTQKTAVSGATVESHSKKVDCYGDPLPEGALARIGTVRFRSGDIIDSKLHDADDVAFLPDGKTIVSVHRGFAVHFWETATGKEIRRLDGFSSGCGNVAVSRDGKKLAVLGRGKIWVWDLGAEPPCLLFQESWPPSIYVNQSAVFAPDGKILAVAVKGGNTRLFDVATGKSLRDKLEMSSQEAVLAFSPGGKILANGRTLLNVETGEKLYGDLKTDGDARLVSFSPDGKNLVIATQKGSISLWNTSTGAKICQFSSDRNSFVAFLPDGQTLLEVDSDWRIHYRDPATGKEKGPAHVVCDHPAKDRGHDCVMGKMCLSSDGKLLVEVCSRCVIVYDLSTGRQIGPTEGYYGSVGALTFAPDSQMLATLSQGNFEEYCSPPRLWKADSGRPGQNLERCNKALFLPYGPIIFLPGHRIEIPSFIMEKEQVKASALTSWDTQTGKAFTVRSPLGAPKSEMFSYPPFYSYAVSPDGRREIWGAGSLALVDRSAKKIVRCLDVGNGGFPVVTLSADGQSILSCFYRDRACGGLEVWSAATGKLLMRKEGNGWVWTLNIDPGLWPGQMSALSPDGRLLAADLGDPGNLDDPALREKREIRIWEVASGTEWKKIKASGTHRVVWSPDGCLLASGDEKGNVWLWDVATGQEVRHFKGHRGPVVALAFSPDGLRLASGSDDTTALVWDLHGLQCQQGANTVQLPSANELWISLRNKEAAKARPIMRLMTQNPDVAVPLLKERLRLNSVDLMLVGKLLAQLDDDDFQVRKRAAEQLEKLSEDIEPALQEALTKKPSPEVHRSINRVLQKQKVDPGNPDSMTLQQLQAYRGVEVLERIGTPAAREVLEELSRLPQGSVQSQEAKAALQRLTKPASALSP